MLNLKQRVLFSRNKHSTAQKQTRLLGQAQKDIKAAFPPPHVWVVKFSEMDNGSLCLDRQVHAGYLTRTKANCPISSSSSSLFLPARWPSRLPLLRL